MNRLGSCVAWLDTHRLCHKMSPKSGSWKSARMATQTLARNAVEVSPFNAQIGAEVRCGDVRALDDTSFRAVQRAFLDNLVLLIRGQQLNDDELVAFAHRFGEPTAAAPVHSGQKPRERPEIAIISNVIEN